MKQATTGIDQLAAHVDTLIVVPNRYLFHVTNERTTFADAFHMADEVLYQGVSGVTDLMLKPGIINLDFADIRSVMTEMGKAMIRGLKHQVKTARLWRLRLRLITRS